MKSSFERDIRLVFFVFVVVAIAFGFGIIVGFSIEKKYSRDKIEHLMQELNETKYWLTIEQKISEAIAEDRQSWKDLYWKAQDRLWLESECLNGTIKQYIEELKRSEDEALEVNTLVLFYAYNSTINKSKLYSFGPNPKEAEKLLKKWGFDVR